MRLLIDVAALLLVSLTGLAAATTSLASVENDHQAPEGVQHRTLGMASTAQHYNNHETVHNLSQKTYQDFPCPLEQDIAPCKCSVDNELRLSLDCSAVVSDEQLASVFNTYFPMTEYFQFVIDQNDNIELLGYILNGVTFQTVSLTKVNNLKAVSEEFLLDSSGTLESLRIDYSALTRGMFPFLTLPMYSQLRSLYISHSSRLTSIPHLTSNTLTYIDFTGCAISYIDPGTFDAVPQLQTLVLHVNDISSFQPGNFDAYPQLQVLHLDSNAINSLHPGSFTPPNSFQYLYLDNNQLTSIEPGAFGVPENSGPTSSHLLIALTDNSLSNLDSNTFIMADRPYELRLFSNRLSNLAAGAFVLPQTTEHFSLNLNLDDNALTFLEEQVLGELFPYITKLRVSGNPLACGCEVAWLVLNPAYMAKIESGAICADGRVFQELDPEYYEAFC